MNNCCKITAALALCMFVACSRPLTPFEAAERAKEADRLLGQAVLLIRESSDPSLDRAWSALTLGQHLAPHDPRFWDGLGAVAYRKRRWEKAEECFTKALQLDPFYAGAYAHLALLAEREGKRKEAKELYETALALQPTFYRGRNNYAAFVAENEGRARLRASYHELLQAEQAAAPGREEILLRNITRMRQAISAANGDKRQAR